MYPDQQIKYNLLKGISPPSEEKIRETAELPVGRTIDGRMDVRSRIGSLVVKDQIRVTRREDKILEVL